MGNFRKWTEEEDAYLLLAFKNGVSKTRIGKRLGVHRNLIRRRLDFLEALANPPPKESEELAAEREHLERCRMLENRKPPPFELWARSMIELSRRQRRQGQSDG